MLNFYKVTFIRKSNNIVYVVGTGRAFDAYTLAYDKYRETGGMKDDHRVLIEEAPFVDWVTKNPLETM